MSYKEEDRRAAIKNTQGRKEHMTVHSLVKEVIFFSENVQ